MNWHKISPWPQVIFDMIRISNRQTNMNINDFFVDFLVSSWLDTDSPVGKHLEQHHRIHFFEFWRVWFFYESCHLLDWKCNLFSSPPALLTRFFADFTEYSLKRCTYKMCNRVTTNNFKINIMNLVRKKKYSQMMFKNITLNNSGSSDWRESFEYKSRILGKYTDKHIYFVF